MRSLYTPCINLVTCSAVQWRCMFPGDAIALFYAYPYGETPRAIAPRCVSYD